MIPKLFAATATTFTTQGIGALTDSILCYVDEERNGEYEGYLKYPITGVHYADIALRSIIVAKPNFTDDPQPFRVYEITKPLNGVVTVRFRHISYDLSGYPVEPFTASTLSAALSGLISNCPVDCPFTLTSSRSVSATFKADVPASIRSWMGGKAGSLLDVYGGEWKYDGFTASLPSSRGQNRGVTIRYGKNLTALEQEENNAAVYTGVYPYWTDAYGENLVQITGRIVHNTDTPTYSGATYDYERILPLDLSSKWEDAPSEGELRSAAIAYIEDNEIGTPKVNLRVEFAQVSKLVRDQVDLCDTVAVQFEKLGVTATAKCIKTRWNVLLDRYEAITLGDAKTNLAETIVNTKKTAETAVSPSALEMAVDQATAQITGANGGYIVWHDSNNDGEPDEMLVMNTPSISTATKVWRFNQNGLGHSNNGYSGTYGLALTADGAIVADRITTGTLNANIIKAGILQDEAGLNFWNMETGEMSIKALSEYGWNPQEDVLQTFAGEDLLTYAGETIRAYSPATYSQIQNNANEINLLAGNAAGMQAQIYLIPGQITAAVSALEGQITAELALEIATDSGGHPYGKISANADYISFNTGDLVINSSGFTLDAAGNATFAGAVTATSLTLGNGVTVPYTKVSGTPDLTVYVQKDGTIGSTPADGSTGFKVSSAGLLTASNAVIWGTIYATNGTFSGTVSGSTITGSTFTSADGKLTIDNDGLILRNGATDADSTQRIIFGVDSNQRLAIGKQYWHTTLNSWQPIRGASITAGSTDSSGFYGSFERLSCEQIMMSYNNGTQTELARKDENGISVVADRLFVGQHGWLGTIRTASNTITSLASNTETNMCSVQLGAGTWLIVAQYSVTGSAAFQYSFGISTDSAHQQTNAGYAQVAATANVSTNCGTLSRIIEVATGTVQQVYLVGWHNYSSAKTVGAGRNSLTAMLIA